MFLYLKKIFCVFLIAVFIIIHSSFTLSKPVLASTPFDFVQPRHIEQLLSNKQLIKDTQNFLKLTPEKICSAYQDKLQGIDNSKWSAIEEMATSALTIFQGVTSASTAGAGSLTGYAGIASSVSKLGLSTLIKIVASMMGSHATGAAATAVVTSAVGGPIVMGAILIGGTGIATFGTYELAKLAAKQLGNWVETSCTL